MRFSGGGRRISREPEVVRGPVGLERDETNVDATLSEGGSGLLAELAG